MNNELLRQILEFDKILFPKTASMLRNNHGFSMNFFVIESIYYTELLHKFVRFFFISFNKTKKTINKRIVHYFLSLAE